MFEAATDQASEIVSRIDGMQSVKKKRQDNHWNQFEIRRYAPGESQFAALQETLAKKS